MLRAYNKAVQRRRKIYRASLREQAGLWIKDRNSAVRRVKFWRNFTAKQRGLNFKIYGSETAR